MQVNYFNIQRFCVFDGPGIRTTLFLKGCPLRCVWCHNPESNESARQLMFNAERCTGCGSCLGLCEARSIEDGKLIIDREKCTLCGRCVDACPLRLNKICGKAGEISEIYKILVRDRDFYRTSGGGITISGGEPSAQSGPVLELIRIAKEDGIEVAIESCGTGSEDFYRRANELGALFLYDIKGIDSEKHKRNTGADNKKIIANLDMLISLGADIILRLPMIPGYNDDDSDLSLLADFISDRKDKIRYAEIMPYHKLGVHKREELGKENTVEGDNASAEQKKRWKDALMKSGAEIRISGN